MLDQNATGQYQFVATKPTQQTPAAIAVSTPTSAPIPLGSIVASTSAVNKSTVTIQIQTNQNTATQGQLIKNKLLEKGYTNILINENAPTTTGKTLIIFSTTIDVTVQQEVTAVISNIFTNFSTQQATQATYNITIIPSNNL